MRAGIVAALGLLSVALGGGVVACFDLFHSTRDILTACQIDAETPGCAADAGVDSGDSGTDFCLWSPDEARKKAQYACAWLGACETPLGRNAFGACMMQALLAYDCAANPHHRVAGKARDLWDCLRKVQTCNAVDACVFGPAGPQPCASSGIFPECARAGATANSDVRVECPDGGAPSRGRYGENCALWGQTCVFQGVGTACAGQTQGPCQSGCSGANRTELGWCGDSGNVGLDCASNGRGRCDGFPDASAPLWVACLADNDSGTICAANAAATCSDGVAFSCPSGVPEKIDCASILQSDAGCLTGPLDPPFDWTSPCVATPAKCTSDSCTDAGLLLACVRGSEQVFNCADQSLGPCQMVWTEMGTVQRASCGPPP